MSLPVINVDTYIPTVQYVTHWEAFIADNDALVNHTFRQARECARETDNLYTIQAENNNDERVDDTRFASSSTMVAENVTMGDTEEMPNLEVMSSESSLDNIKDGVVKIEEEDKVLNSEDYDQPEFQDVIDVTPTDAHVEVMPKPDSPVRSSPDINAYDYCHSCQTKFLSNWNYRVHLRLVHRIYVKEETKEEVHDISDGAILPDPRNSDCVHYMILGPRKKLKPVPDDPNNYCCVCDITCHTRALYAEHYRSTHQSISVTGSNANMRTKPKLNDASNHCCSCDRQFASKTLYCKHLAF
ncbi:hypothetical protein HMPREF1544_12141 [Mucor circinelloides 1006PhL]|uniref:C2H2-type domain-containing protein n=1 Tax=Mucor circinelloides f. circinelloides (strain 1006PhL) TaxID=1220926 RepID=S2IV35_MUCC1|nr:hypothetical protein HMPREF1544_12141 [Mucor circinelloides 1006PhL]